ncbi:GTP-binding protein, partial [uncultured Clostridium sp.]|uniref:GTP-binding protein n=1 Tax=uncultured Clostridium sp. TaxID=59620 RepID=UPI0025F6A24E
MKILKIDIEVVTGFLGYGKTSFINSLLKESQVVGEKVLIIQMEEGNRSIFQIKDINYPIKILKIDNLKDLKNCLKGESKKFKPNRIIIEFNGTEDIKSFKDKLEDKEIKKIMRLSTIYFVADGTKLLNNINNLGYYIVPFIRSTDMIIINNTEKIEKENLKKEINALRQINQKAFILKVDNKFNLSSKL